VNESVVISARLDGRESRSRSRGGAPHSRMGGATGQPRIGSGFAGEALSSSCNSVRDIIDGRMPCAGNVAGGLRLLRDGSQSTSC